GQSTTGAHEDALESMKKLQTLLITGSLPVKLEIANVNTMSPVLGDDFSRIVTYIGLLAVLATIIVVTVRYREWKIAIPIAITMISEVVILLGFASFIGWNIDIVAIAAIIIAIGSGVDDQIVITDETLGRRKRKHESIIDWKAQLKKAFFIIMASYFTLVVAMIPLMFAGAGLLMGFAITTIAGVTIGVLVTRPAFAAILEILLEK
ncbi:protein translocase subunit SecD, partial [Candidatus Woesearchaeota archaeon]|nr:protein translocase subunit SecD [Candidatus Woesearchaeota archaeon]